MKKISEHPNVKFIKAAFSTDPRAIAWAKTRFEVKPDDKAALVKAIDRLFEMADGGMQPQADWLKDAKDLAERLGQAWDFRYEAADDVVKKQVDIARKRGNVIGEGATEVTFNGHRIGTPNVRPRVMGIPATTIPPGATVTVAVQPYAPFRMCRLVIDDAVAPMIVVNDLKIGRNCQFGNAEPIAGAAFAARAFPLPLKCDTAQVSQRIDLTVTNVYASCFLLTGALHGLVVE